MSSESMTLYTEDQAAKVLGFTKKTLRKWRSEGGGPRYLKINRSVRYRAADLEAWVDGHLSKASTSDPGRPLGVVMPARLSAGGRM